MRVAKYRQSRFFAVYDTYGELVAVTVYKRGALEVARRLSEQASPSVATGIGSSQEAGALAQADAPAASRRFLQRG